MKSLCKIFTLFILAVVVLPMPANAYIDRGIAVLRVLNKAAGKTNTVRVPVGYSVKYEKLEIAVRSCKQTDPFDAENYFAFLEVDDGAQGQIFGGWMNRNEPGKNPLQSPDWDIWLTGCEDEKGE